MMNVRPPFKQRGFVLIEALIGILIFSLGILAMLGMQAVGMRTVIDAKYRSEAAFLANQIVSEMWVDRPDLANYDTTTGTGTSERAAWIAQVQNTLPQATGANAPTIAVLGQQVIVTVSWQRPGVPTASQQKLIAQINNP